MPKVPKVPKVGKSWILDAGFLSGLEIMVRQTHHPERSRKRDWLLRFTGEEISNLDAISLSNCPK